MTQYDHEGTYIRQRKSNLIDMLNRQIDVYGRETEAENDAVMALECAIDDLTRWEEAAKQIEFKEKR